MDFLRPHSVAKLPTCGNGVQDETRHTHIYVYGHFQPMSMKCDLDYDRSNCALLIVLKWSSRSKIMISAISPSRNPILFWTIVILMFTDCSAYVSFSRDMWQQNLCLENSDTCLGLSPIKWFYLRTMKERVLNTILKLSHQYRNLIGFSITHRNPLDEHYRAHLLHINERSEIQFNVRSNIS